MKTVVGFLIAFLFFSVGVQGRIGSMLAVFIDPSALMTTSSISGVPGILPAVPGGPFTQGTPAGPATMPVDPTIKTNGGCKQGYLPIGGTCFRVVEIAN